MRQHAVGVPVGALSRARLRSRVPCAGRRAHPRLGREGFTFAELMTVFTIIAILAAILFPVFARAREKARQASCGLNLHNIGMAMRVYASEHYGHLPPTDNDLWPLVPKYLPESETLVCPSVAGELRQRYQRDMPGRKGDPADKPCDYIYRSGFCDDEKPSTVYAADDEAYRHNGGANYLYLDGHCKWLNDYTNQQMPGGTMGDGYEELRKLGVPSPSQSMPPGGSPPPGGGAPPPPPSDGRL